MVSVKCNHYLADSNSTYFDQTFLIISFSTLYSFSSHVDPSEHFLAWAKPALNVLVIKKVMDQDVTKCFKELTRWLIEVSACNLFPMEAGSRQ